MTATYIVENAVVEQVTGRAIKVPNLALTENEDKVLAFRCGKFTSARTTLPSPQTRTLKSTTPTPTPLTAACHMDKPVISWTGKSGKNFTMVRHLAPIKLTPHTK